MREKKPRRMAYFHLHLGSAVAPQRPLVSARMNSRLLGFAVFSASVALFIGDAQTVWAEDLPPPTVHIPAYPIVVSRILEEDLGGSPTHRRSPLITTLGESQPRSGLITPLSTSTKVRKPLQANMARRSVPMSSPIVRAGLGGAIGAKGGSVINALGITREELIQKLNAWGGGSMYWGDEPAPGDSDHRVRIAVVRQGFYAGNRDLDAPGVPQRDELGRIVLGKKPEDSPWKKDEGIQNVNGKQTRVWSLTNISHNQRAVNQPSPGAPIPVRVEALGVQNINGKPTRVLNFTNLPEKPAPSPTSSPTQFARN